MTELLAQLRRNQQRGSKPRCHGLTHGDSARRAATLTGLIAPWGEVGSDDVCVPDGFNDVREAQLHTAVRLLTDGVRSALASWWLAVPSTKATTPNWDIACTCRIGDDRGLLLIEAKAHHGELQKEECGKALMFPVSANSMRKVHQFVDPGLRRAQHTWVDLSVPPRLREVAEESWQALSGLAVPDGDTPDNIRNHPALKGLNIGKTGQPGTSGVGLMVTKTVVVMGDPQVTNPGNRPRGAMLRAYDKKTGQQVGELLMPAPQSGSPMTYSVGGRQFIVVAVSGGNYTGEYLAFALPQSETRPTQGQ